MNNMSLDCDQEQIFVFDDRDHNSFLLEKLNTLRKNKQFCDVILQVGTQQDVSKEIYGHRAILASASRYFLDIFTNDFNQSTCGTHQIQLYKLLSNKYDVDAFNYLLDFIYTGRLEVPKKHVRSVYALAVRLKMSSVVHKCGDFLASTLTPETCLTIRSINGVLNDRILLNSVDNYIKEKISEVIKSKYVEKLFKIKIEVLQNSDEEIDSVNPRHLFQLISDWIRKEFDENRLTSDQLLMKTYMLYLNTLDRSLHDCLDIENSDHNYSEVIHEYKSLSRKLSTTKRSTENVNLNGLNQFNRASDQECSSPNGNSNEFMTGDNHVKDEVVQNLIKNNSKPHHGKKKNTGPKPKQFMFTRSDSDSSLSSIANDDDENDWKILAIDSNGSKNNLNGLLMIAGKLYLLSVKLKIHSPHTTRNNSLEKPEIYSTVSLMNNVRCSLGSACLNGKLVVCGGYNRSEVLKTVEVYDALTNKWAYLEPMKVARARFNVCVIEDKLYAIGGSDGLKELNSAEVYDSQSNSWKFIARCPIERSNAGVCSLNGLVYVVGGWNNGHNGLQRCDVYNPATDEWKQIGDLNCGRYQVSVTVMNGKIYCAGGCNYTCLNSVERYDPENDSWELIEPMQLARRGCGICSYDNKVWVIGGHDGVYSLASTEIFDPKENTWLKGPSLQVCRANVSVSVVDNTVWIVGGFSGKQFLNTLEYLDAKNQEFTNFLVKKDVNGNLKLVREKTLTNEDECSDAIANKMRISDGDAKRDEKANNGDRKDSKLSLEFKKSKEPLVEVEGEKMDDAN